jgi:hypothetical protein
MAEQYSVDMMVGLDRVVAKKVEPYQFRQPVMRTANFPLPPGVFTVDICPYFAIGDWLPFIFFCELERRMQGATLKPHAFGSSDLYGFVPLKPLRRCSL